MSERVITLCYLVLTLNYLVSKKKKKKKKPFQTLRKPGLDVFWGLQHVSSYKFNIQSLTDLLSYDGQYLFIWGFLPSFRFTPWTERCPSLSSTWAWVYSSSPCVPQRGEYRSTVAGCWPQPPPPTSPDGQYVSSAGVHQPHKEMSVCVMFALCPFHH